MTKVSFSMLQRRAGAVAPARRAGAKPESARVHGAGAAEGAKWVRGADGAYPLATLSRCRVASSILKIDGVIPPRQAARWSLPP